MKNNAGNTDFCKIYLQRGDFGSRQPIFPTRNKALVKRSQEMIQLG